MSGALVKTIPRDHLRLTAIPDAKTAPDLIDGWLQDDTEDHPHPGPGERAPRTFSQALQPSHTLQ